LEAESNLAYLRKKEQLFAAHGLTNIEVAAAIAAVQS
jgi:hypothetical protein